MNNGKYHTEEYRLKQAQKVDRLFGIIEDHTKKCERCETDYIFLGRLKTKEFQRSKYCSVSCAANRQEWWNKNAIGYKTIALQTHSHECQICGFDKIVAIHHIDENHNNNSIDNLIPLCPNHHEMYHSKWQDEVKPNILEWQNKFRESKG